MYIACISTRIWPVAYNFLAVVAVTLEALLVTFHDAVTVYILSNLKLAERQEDVCRTGFTMRIE